MVLLRGPKTFSKKITGKKLIIDFRDRTGVEDPDFAKKGKSGRDDEIRRVVLALIRSSDVVTVKSNYQIVKEDPKDDIIINTAYDGNADFYSNWR